MYVYTPRNVDMACRDICMCIIYICTYTYVYVCRYVFLYTDKKVCRYACIGMCVFCIYTYMSVRQYSLYNPVPWMNGGVLSLLRVLAQLKNEGIAFGVLATI